LFAEGTRMWFQSRYDEFEKGTAKGIAIRSDGVLELSPSLKQVATTPSTYVWSVVADRDGSAFVAAGSPARVYHISPQGQTTVVFEPQELQVQALLIGRDGDLYAATSPDGKVYRITHAAAQTASAKNAKAAAPIASQQNSDQPANATADPSYGASVYFDPKTKYIWALAEDSEGRLYVATGDRGEIYRVDKGGSGSVFFKSDEAHIRALAFDPKGNLIAGSDGSGLIYRISPTGDAFVLYSAPKKEITALAIDKEGNIYAAGAVEKRGEGTGALSPGTVQSVVIPVPAQTGAAPVPAQPVVPTGPIASFTASGGSEIYRISPDGSPKRIWQSREELVYALAFDPRGRLVAGSGNRGRIFIIGENEFTDLGRASATQVTGIAEAPNGGLYVATSNLGKLFLYGGSPDADGTFESDVFDAKIFSRWGRAVARGTGSFELFARSGNVDNPDRNWSEWKKIDLARETPMDIPPARFVQWRAVLHPGSPAASIDSVLLNYLPKNVTPQVDDVYVQPGAKFAPVSKSADTLTVPVGPPPGGSTSSKFETLPSAIRDSGSIAVRWTAHDDNDDDLTYSVYYKGDRENRWKLLKDNLDDKYYSFDSALLPDGGYTIMVVASDSPSHTPEEALSDSKVSARFEVDSTPPQVTNVAGTVENGTIHITFRAIDGFSPIARAEYSIDAGDWHAVEPVGQISDYRIENYDFAVPLPVADETLENEPKSTDAAAPSGKRKKAAKAPSEPGEEHVVVVRVYDRFDNMGSSKAVVQGR
jgi:WD40 repeat protein